LLRDFDRSLSYVKRSLFSWLGDEETTRLIRESQQEYDALIPRILFIGSKNPLLGFLLPTTRYLAVYRALQRQGLTLEDDGHLAFEIETEELRAIPSIACRFMGYLWFSPWFTERLKKGEIITHQRRYPGETS